MRSGDSENTIKHKELRTLTMQSSSLCMIIKNRYDYFSSSMAACAAAKRAMGTRNGEQLA